MVTVPPVSLSPIWALTSPTRPWTAISGSPESIGVSLGWRTANTSPTDSASARRAQRVALRSGDPVDAIEHRPTPAYGSSSSDWTPTARSMRQPEARAAVCSQQRGLADTGLAAHDEAAAPAAAHGLDQPVERPALRLPPHEDRARRRCHAAGAGSGIRATPVATPTVPGSRRSASQSLRSPAGSTSRLTSMIRSSLAGDEVEQRPGESVRLGPGEGVGTAPGLYEPRIVRESQQRSASAFLR
jgi:hypothetical protein